MSDPSGPDRPSYSRTWFETFATALDGAQRTEAEVGCLARMLPFATHRRILDVPCGRGRHATRLADLGYIVMAADRDPAAVDAARTALAGRGTAVRADLRDLGPCGGPFDAIVNLWQSFGMFDDAENEAVLRGMARRVRPGGRIVVDVYDLDRFVPATGVTTLTFPRGTVRQSTEFGDRRLRVQLQYSWSPDSDSFDWRLYRRAEFRELAAAADLTILTVGEDFDAPLLAEGGAPRAQYLMERQVE